MANVSNEMVITNTALSQIGKELINKRIYEDGTIQIVGNPIITDGIATNISSNNYFESTNFSFDKVIRSAEISFAGIYSPSNGVQCCSWELQSEHGNLMLTIENNMVLLKFNNVTILSISYLSFVLENTFKALVTFFNTYDDEEHLNQSCSIRLILNDEVLETTAIIENPIKFSNFSSLTLGNNKSTNLPWQGNIYLADFALSQNDHIIYTPSIKNSFIFTKVGIGDGSTPLTDRYTPILSHIYYFDVVEITRTENNVLLTCTIPPDAYLTITELALYYVDGNGTSHIFSKITGLSVAKGSNLAYNLVMHVKLDINTVNTVAVPEIVVGSKNYTKYTDFLTIKNVYAYITENTERLVRLNALGIGKYDNNSMQMQKDNGLGFNRPQILYKHQNDMDLCLDDCAATTNYAKLKKRFTPYSVKTFNPEGLQVEGNAYLSEGGVGGAFSTSDYIKATDSYYTSNSTNWELNLRFHVYSIETDQCIFSSVNVDNGTKPLSVEIRNGDLFLTLINENSTIYNNSIHSLENNANYEVVISHSEGVYKVVWNQLDSPNKGEVIIPSDFGINDLTHVYFGAYCNTIDLSFSNPFNGTIDFMGVSFKTEDYNNYSELISSSIINYITVTTTELSLGDYFHIPDYSHHYYHVNNLGYEGTSYLEVYEGAFKGYYDRIDFLSSPLGFTLCAKVEMPDVKPEDIEKAQREETPVEKIVLAKGNIISETYYFIIKEVIAPTRKVSLVFELYLQNSKVVIRKELTTENIRSYIEHPITLTITCDGNQYSPTFKMYKNKELIGSYLLPDFDNINMNEMYLMNHAHFTGDEDLEEHTVHDIIGIIGEVSSDDLYYINNVLDTNF